MRKIRLDLDRLEVDTFEATARHQERGTVVAHSGWTECGNLTCLLSLCPDCWPPK
jgi:hypothetical protein